MWCLALVWVLAATEILAEDNDTIVNTTRRHIEGDNLLRIYSEPTAMVSADWDSDGMSVPLSNSSGRFTSLEALLEVFNPHRLAREWEYPPRDMTAMCGLHVHQYLEHLNKGELWALKSKYLFFYLSLFRDASTSLVISRLGSLCVCTRRLCISIVVLSMFHLLSSPILIL